MCGIAGIYQFNKEPADGEIIRRMTRAISHRGPDAEGFYINGPIALGHRRLSILDLSAASNQPFSDVSGRHQLIFNGELYNYREVQKSLTDFQFRTTSDTEVLFEAFKRKGPECILSFKGMFTFAMWDNEKEELCIARDRLGVKPLYYYQDQDFFIFASEVRAILSTGKVKKNINQSALVDYFSYQSVSSPDTIIEGIKQLEAGHVLTIRNGTVDIKQYWDLTMKNNSGDYIEEKVIKKQVHDLLLHAVEQRLISDVPIGAFLSGGIDSSAVVGLMAAVSPERPNTFTVSFEEKEFDESPYAELVAKKFNTRHQRILLKPEVMLDELTNALDAMDSPSGDGINSYVVSKAVKNAGITVALSGVGGDELFAGYPFFTRFKTLQKFSGIWPLTMPVRKLLDVFIPGQSIGGRKLKQILQLENTGIESVYPVLRSVLSPKQISSLLILEEKQIRTNIEDKLFEKASSIHEFPGYSQVSIAEFMGYTQQTLLKDMDQMSMAVSLEVREPFFDHQLIEYVLGIPDQFKHPVYPKKLMVESLGNLLPSEIVHRKKQGFVFPWSLWMKNELKEFCEIRINNLCQRSFIQADQLKTLWTEFQNGKANVRWLDIWLFVVLEYWLEKNVD